MSNKNQPFFSWRDSLCAAAAFVVFIIVLEVCGYSIGDRGLPGWWFFPVTAIYIVLRVAWSKKNP